MNFNEHLSVAQFEKIKNFILENGNRQTYRNFDNNSPHYRINNFDVFLSPSTGQKNINCDPLLSDFNQIVIRDPDNEIQYYFILIVRQGDKKNKDIFVSEEIEENAVYLDNPYNEDIGKLKENLLNFYLPELKKLA